MLRTVCVCEKCQDQTLCSDDGDGHFVFDFVNRCIIFLCPKCLHENRLFLGEIEKALKDRYKFPRIGSV